MRAPHAHAQPAAADAPTKRPRRLRWIALYLALLAASHIVIALRAPDPHAPFTPSDERAKVVHIPTMTDGGHAPGSHEMRLAYLEWLPEAGPDLGRPPVLLLHGSPGRASNFDDLAPLLAASGYRVIAPDLPGFGDSTRDVPSYSTRAHARAALALLDTLGIRRAHILGWSMGGGVAFHMLDLAPTRAASLTLLASVGDQAAEGSGSYAFEHAKYLVGYALLVGLPELVPHFGLLGTRDGGLGEFRHSFIRNFLDSDQRPYRRIMRSIATPTLILHGRHDFLTPDSAAEISHRLIAPSRLVMIDASHFLPLLQPEETAAHLTAFLRRHDTPGVPALRQTVDLAPKPAWILGPVGQAAEWTVRALPWWAMILAIAVAAAFAPTVTLLTSALLGATILLDFGVAIAGLSLAAAAFPPRSPLDPAAPTPGRRAVRALVAVPLLYILASVLSETVILTLAAESGLIGLAAASAASLGVLVLASHVFTRRGRRDLAVRLHRAMHHEFWPGWLFYLPLLPYLLYLALRHGGLTTVTCVNRGIGGGGGFIGESKTAIIDALRAHPAVASHTLPARVVEPGPDPAARAQHAIDIIRGDPELGGFPVILKPDAGLRGFGLRLARSEADVREYFITQTRAVQIQAYHPGPHEVGIVWVRRPGSITGKDAGPLAGSIYAVTRKDFPVVTGDGVSTLEQLILAHPRCRLQAATFLARLGPRAREVPAAGQRVRLAEAGNHCQGTLFRDGADLITPALEAAIDRVARHYGWKPGDGEDTHLLDYGRFDLRFRSEAALMAGDLDGGIVEFNGVTGEPTALYDPDRSLLWAYRLLFGQWRRLYRLGALRRARGAAPMRLRDTVAAAVRFYRGRPGSAVSD